MIGIETATQIVADGQELGYSGKKFFALLGLPNMDPGPARRAIAELDADTVAPLVALLAQRAQLRDRIIAAKRARGDRNAESWWKAYWLEPVEKLETIAAELETRATAK